MLRCRQLLSPLRHCPRLQEVRKLSFDNTSIFTKIVSSNSDKYFDKNLEKDLYRWWESAGYFKPSSDKIGCSNLPSYVVPMPPPNVTGSLHMGHALFSTLQDIFVRYRRMSGYNVLWLPGTDHAGIATQMVVEKDIIKQSKGKLSRITMGRDQFTDSVWKWKHQTGDYITRQLRLLGASADWSREKFTLDSDINYAVIEAFKQLHDKGLVYRSNAYMVHWSPVLQTALSDLEVEYHEEEGFLYTFKYMLKNHTNDINDSSNYIPIATTRPETILGDTAICIPVNCPRYGHLIGQSCIVPFVGREIPIIADQAVDAAFGTGALKVTPAHDAIDYAIGLRHQLPVVSILNKDGSINEIGQCGVKSYEKLDRFECRKQIWKDLEESGQAISKTKHIQRVPRSQRSGEIVESMASPQWFIRTTDMARKAGNALKTKQMTIIPDRYEKTWYNWLNPETIRDWCVSRQLWWGHRIPVYYVCGTDKQEYVVAHSLSEAEQLIQSKFGRKLGEFQVEQEEDVLDTWFSSGMWPFATVGWPTAVSSTASLQQSSDYSRFYPADLLETGHDILFFWVARMVMLGIELTGQLPFHTVYLHGLVTDENGQKMSKSKGNVIDPIAMIDQFGTDVLRFSLITSSSTTHDISLSTKHMETTKTFITKLWNLGKYAEHMMVSLTPSEQMHIVHKACQYQSMLADVSPMTERNVKDITELLPHLSLVDKVIVDKCHRLVEVVSHSLLDSPPGRKATHYLDNIDTDGNGAYSHGHATVQHSPPQVSEAARAIYDFIWSEYADWYVELNKLQLQESIKANDTERRNTSLIVNAYIWQICLKLLHPFTPFVTEALWINHHRNRNSSDVSGLTAEDRNASSDIQSIMLSQWPGIQRYDNENNSSSMLIPWTKDQYPNLLTHDSSQQSLNDSYHCLQEVVRAIRNIKSEHKLEPNFKLSSVIVHFPSANNNDSNTTVSHATAVSDLYHSLVSVKSLVEGVAKVQHIEFIQSSDLTSHVEIDKQTHAQAVIVQGVTVCISRNHLIPVGQSSSVADDSKQKEQARLIKQKEKISLHIQQLEEKLQPTHPYFMKANESNVLKTKQQLEKLRLEFAAMNHV